MAAEIALAITFTSTVLRLTGSGRLVVKSENRCPGTLASKNFEAGHPPFWKAQNIIYDNKVQSENLVGLGRGFQVTRLMQKLAIEDIFNSPRPLTSRVTARSGISGEGPK